MEKGQVFYMLEKTNRIEILPIVFLDSITTIFGNIYYFYRKDIERKVFTLDELNMEFVFSSYDEAVGSVQYKRLIDEEIKLVNNKIAFGMSRIETFNYEVEKLIEVIDNYKKYIQELQNLKGNKK